MADKKVDATTGEVKVERGPAVITVGPEQPILSYDGELPTLSKVYIVHCKPVYNYQSVEFDVAIHEDTQEYDLGYMEGLYARMLEMLIRVSQNAPQAEAKKPAAPVEELASERQKEILRNFHIDFKEPLTKKQAHALIKKSMDQDIF